MKLIILFVLLSFPFTLYGQGSDYEIPAILEGDSKNISSGKFSDTGKADEMTGLGAYGMSSFTNLGSGEIYYLLIGDTISLFDSESKAFSNTRRLDLFLDSDLEPEIVQVYANNNVIPEARIAENLSPILGCYFQYPLRYGDLNKDGTNELIVFAQDEFGALNFNVFSTASNQIIFNIRLATYDAKINNRLTLPEGEVESASDPLADAPTDGQYLSKIVEERTRMIRGIQPAVINFSKLYFDDFDEDGAEDIVVWRKLYQSRENQDVVKGFSLLRESFVHYRFNGGTYTKQQAADNQVSSWLQSQTLTWQKGYPSQSECTGQTDQLIPEMHDVLLNDSEVLQ